MIETIETALKSSFDSEMQKALVNILYTSTKIKNSHKAILSKYDLSLQQFNILRILRGQKGNPVTLKLITSRMISPMSNTSRLIDKLIVKQWVAREQSDADRRAVKIYITEQGLEQVEKAKAELNQHINSFEDIDIDLLQKFNKACDAIRRVL